ncbi:Rieske 2Fe-2S domain-containing protein [Rhizosaccharibacter radicis]|uniref:Aromatic ring-hydroxylating dioxygenase subunit alpha n=1 Tax=Rhizosaccharibacter radicis TaxID=2782605 RepID=A0ABT1VVK9_9PROT|nr:aromatic ring-hydroxylating dioxygenase subunit alpha [Acetobacteraceae bacterium KSS12]
MNKPVPPQSLRPDPDLPTCDLRRVGAHPDHWYPVAWSRELKRGGTLATAFAGEPIVLVRPRNGPVFALEDRCAHRQVPLSKGTVDGCAVRCCYHGWAYNADGRCTDVPYLGKDRLPNGVRAYPVREVGSLILVFPGDPALADVTPLPGFAALEDPAYKTRKFGRFVRCHYSFMHENLMDMNHQFMHSKQMGQMKPRVLGQKREAGSIEVRYSFSRVGGKQPLGEAVIFGERRGADKALAERDVMTVRTEYPYQTLRISTDGQPAVMDLWICYTPQDKEQRTNRTFGLLSVRRPKVPFVIDLLWPLLVAFTERIFKEDRDIVELEQAAHDSQGCDLNQEVFPVIRSLRGLLAEEGVRLPQPAL